MPDNINENIEREKFFSTMYKDLGMTHYAKDETQQALSYFKEALSHFYILWEATKDSESNKKTFEEIQITKSLITEIIKRDGDNEYQKQNFDKALEFYQNILYYDLSNADVFERISTCLERKGAYVSAAEFCKKAVELDSDNASLYSFLGYIYGYKLNDYKQAIFYLEQYIDRNPNDAYAYNSLGYLNEKYYGEKNTDEQIRLFQHALALKPDFSGTIRNLAITYPRVERFDEANSCYKKLFELENLADDYFSYACLQIKLGNFEEGWKYFEKRFDKKFDPTSYPQINKPLWNGEHIPGKTLLVNFEQGFGDTLQFFRYIPLLKVFVGKIILRVQDSLFELIKDNTDVETVGNSVNINELDFDYHIPMMSLPAIFKMNKENIPFHDEYLNADKTKIEIFKKGIFYTENETKIGIAWHGSDIGNKKRNIHIESFKPLLEKENCKIYSFQKDSNEDEISKLSPHVYNLAKVFKDFSDTAAALKNIDVLITSDNCLVHLAGALGVKTILLLNHDSEWRWFFDTETTPWYDSVKIIKKTDESQSWESLIKMVAAEI